LNFEKNGSIITERPTSVFLPVVTCEIMTSMVRSTWHAHRPQLSLIK